MRDLAIVIIVICLVISHKVTPLNSSSLAFLWSVALCITMAQWKQWQRQAATDIFSKAIHNSLTLFDESLTPGCWNSLVISEIYWGLLLGILGSHQLKFSPLDFFCKPSVLMTLIPNALAQWFFWLGAISTGVMRRLKIWFPSSHKLSGWRSAFRGCGHMTSSVVAYTWLLRSWQCMMIVYTWSLGIWHMTKEF